MTDERNLGLPFAIETVTDKDIRNGTKPSDYTVYTEEIEQLMDEGKIKDQFKYEITMATLWRLADAGNNANLEGNDAKRYLDEFYKFSRDAKNKEITDKVVISLMSVVFRKSENYGWGLNPMSEEMENFVLNYSKGRLAELRTSNKSEQHQRLAKTINDVLEKQEAQAEINDGSEDIDDLLMGEFGGRYELSERFVEGLRDLLSEDDKKAAGNAFMSDIEGLNEELK